MPVAARQNAPPSALTAGAGTVLLIEDDAQLARSLVRIISSEGYEVVHVGGAAAAVDKVMNRSFDAVISDLNLPGASGVDVLNVVRAYDPDVPLVLMTGCPTVDTAIEAVSLGVLEYLVKPTPREQLLRVLGRATSARRAALHRREAAEGERFAVGTAETVRPPASGIEPTAAAVVLNPDAPLSSRASWSAAEALPPDSRNSVQGTRIATNRSCSSMRATFERAMASLTVELEPLADAKTKKLLGYAARPFSSEETLATEAALVVTAERIGRLEELRRRARDLAVKAFVDAPLEALLFVDVNPSDLRDGELYSPDPPLARIADRVVLQVRARGQVDDLSARASVLRFIGYRLAIADLDVGHACLAQMADLSPEYVKLDARLVRGLDASPGRRRLVAALVAMCRSLDAIAVAEGVSTAEECDALAEAGCEVVQGAILVRHAAAISVRRPGLSSTIRTK